MSARQPRPVMRDAIAAAVAEAMEDMGAASEPARVTQRSSLTLPLVGGILLVAVIGAAEWFREVNRIDSLELIVRELQVTQDQVRDQMTQSREQIAQLASRMDRTLDMLEESRTRADIYTRNQALVECLASAAVNNDVCTHPDAGVYLGVLVRERETVGSPE